VSHLVGDIKRLTSTGEDGLGRFFLGEHLETHAPCTLQMIKPHLVAGEEARRVLARGVRLLTDLRHPDIVSPDGLITAEDGLYLFTQATFSETLDDLMRNPLPVAEVVALFEPILAALNFAHSKGIVHRALEPRRIVLDFDGKPKVREFFPIPLEETAYAGLENVVGNATYLSPEQILPIYARDQRIDVYAVGILLYRMVTGIHPFPGVSGEIIREKQVRVTPADPRERVRHLPEELSRVIMRALEKNPDDRFAGCGEMMQHLGRVPTHTPTRRERPAPVRKTVEKPPPRRREKAPEQSPSQAEPLFTDTRGRNILAWFPMIAIAFSGIIYVSFAQKGALPLDFDFLDRIAYTNFHYHRIKQAIHYYAGSVFLSLFLLRCLLGKPKKPRGPLLAVLAGILVTSAAWSVVMNRVMHSLIATAIHADLIQLSVVNGVTIRSETSDSAFMAIWFFCIFLIALAASLAARIVEGPETPIPS